MGRVNRLMERRALRRAAEAALITSMQQRPVDATAGWPGGAPDQDFEYTWSDPDDTGVSYDRDPVTEPIPVAEVQNLVPDQPDDYAWDDHDEVPAGSAEIPPEPVDVYELVPEQPDDHEWDDDRDEVPPAAVEVRPLRARPLAAGDLVHPAVGMPMPENLPQPWYRTKQAVTVLAAAPPSSPWCAAVGWCCGARAPPPNNRRSMHRRAPRLPRAGSNPPR